LIQKSKVLLVTSRSRRTRPWKVPCVLSHCTCIFIHTLCISTTNSNLIWKDLVDFYHPIDWCKELKIYNIKFYLDLIFFCNFSFVIKKRKAYL
jgi:hypothetical protein